MFSKHQLTDETLIYTEQPSCEKVCNPKRCEIKGVSQEMKVNGENFNNDNLGEFLCSPPSFTRTQHHICLNYQISTITAISWLPPLISHPGILGLHTFRSLTVLYRYHFSYTPVYSQTLWDMQFDCFGFFL